MAVTNRMNLLLFCLFCYYEIQPAACKPVWMSPKFPCDVTADNNSEVIFDCKERLLTRVPYGITSNVTQLNLSENHISNISVKSFPNLPNLTLLDLSWANKKDCLNFDVNAFKNMTKLNHLKLAGNCVNEIPRYLPPSVEKISLDNNRIVKLGNRSFAGLTNVTHLWLSRNCYIWNPCGNFMTIEEGSFAVMTKLETLDLSFNNLSHVPKGLPQTLYNLKLDHNRIESILEDDFRGLHNLQTLKIQGNCPRCQNAPYPCVPCKNGSLGIHPDAFHSLTELLMLHLGGNSLDYLNPSWFKSLSKLRDIFLSFNYLIKVITEDATFLKYIPMIQKIDLSFNFALRYYPTTLNLAQEFSNLTSLRTLHLEGLVFQNIEEGTLRSLYELKNLSALNLGTNFIIHSKSAIFKRFQHVKMIYLAENRLYPVSVTNTPYTSNGYIQRSDFSVSPLTTSHRKYPDYELTHTLIKKECFDSGRVLILSSNNLFFITPQQFDGYGDIACLNLSGNGFSAALNGTEFSSLPNLTYLDLSYNKIDLAYDYAFQELSKLKVLDLSHNSHYFEAYGITHNLHFIKNLPVLRVLNMSHNSISTLATKQMHSKSLTELQFTNNHLGTMWKERDGTYEMLFTNLTNLTILDISENEITKIPFNVYGHLPQNLTKLYIQKNLLTDFNWTALKHFPQLEILDLSFNSLSNVSSVNAKVTQSLTFLDLTGNHIFQLDSGFIKGPKSLTTVSLSHNKLTTINQSTFQMTPDNQIQTLFLQGNPFECTCDSLDFILWLENSGIKIPRLTTQVTCATPENQRNKVLIYFDINQCVNNSLAFLIYTVTASVIIAFMFVVTVAHLFYWDAFYVIYYIKAKWKGYRSLNSSDSIYDVFVTYDTNDPQVSEWVMSNLRVELEDEEDKHLPLCLEERDWTPGVPLVDNLTQSIQYSRKTLFVLTEGYVKTGVFKLAMYLAHQRLLDENVDVIVLLMLEPVLQHSHFLRLRRRLCEKSVVVWPRTAAAEPWFWQNLRNVVRVDNQVIYNKTYSKYFASK